MCFDLSFFIKRQFGISVRWVGEWVCEWESLGRVSGVGGSGSSQIFFCVESLGRVFGPSCTRQTMKFAILMMLIEQMCWRSRNWGASRLLLENLFVYTEFHLKISLREIFKWNSVLTRHSWKKTCFIMAISMEVNSRVLQHIFARQANIIARSVKSALLTSANSQI